ncbi:glycosyltransferase [Thermodesulfobacteriota bacterium]
MAKWLILAHCFNMDGRAASHTITDRMPYLMKNGVLPVVLSAPTGVKDRRFPHFRILSPAPSGILFEMRQIIKRIFPKPAVEKSHKALWTILCLPFYVIEKIFIHLDSQWSWFLSATIRGFFIVKKYRPKLIYSAAGPPSTHIAGYFLHRLLNVPWLAELYDPLIFDTDSTESQRFQFKRYVERTIFKHADAVIYFTNKALESAERRNGYRNNLNMIRPGAPPEDFSEIEYKKLEKIHFGHFGVLGDGRDLSAVIKVLHELISESPSWKNKITMDIYGAALDSVSRKALNEYPLGSVLREHGRLEYDPVTGKSGRRQVLEAMRKCDVLLVIHGTDIVCEEYVPSKVYEYFLTSRPIFGMGLPGSELDDLLTQNGNVFSDINDFQKVKGCIADFIKRWEEVGLTDNTSNIPITVEAYVAKLMRIADSITSIK